MKKILLSILAVLVIAVPNAAAHTYLDTTNPADGAIVVEPLQSIELLYAGKIEVGSTFKVIASNGEQLETANISLVDGVLTGTFENPLPNDSYTVQWNSISEDGHPLSGEFSFTVDAPIIEEIVEEAPVEEAEEIEEATEVSLSEPTETNQEEETGNSSLFIIGGILVLVILISILIFVKRKNTK